VMKDISSQQPALLCDDGEGCKAAAVQQGIPGVWRGGVGVSGACSSHGSGGSGASSGSTLPQVRGAWGRTQWARDLCAVGRWPAARSFRLVQCSDM
jgi:hypothetical protein